ncbi:hypothetical protein KAU39_04850 [bacterium]|nr:hypothetical protein [bacterium]
MKNKKCINCEEYKRCKDTHTSWMFFIIGIIATIAIRVVTVLIHIDPLYGKISWYVGVGGFFIFFVYKFKVTQTRAKLINQQNIVNKIRQKEQLTEEDYILVGNILCSISSNKDKINYFFIFVLSALALILALYFDFVK